MKSRLALVSAACILIVGAGCSKAREAMTRGTSETQALSAQPADCGHAVCADHFFIDAAPVNCKAGSPCSATLKLVATGDDAPGVAFLGTDDNGKNAFSKAAGDWQRADAKSGAMTVKFVAADPGAKAIGGTLKLSVCSAQACLLEQRQVTASVVTN
jgi:hypothetical protein